MLYGGISSVVGAVCKRRIRRSKGDKLISDRQSDHQNVHQNDRQEELFFDGEKYVTREEFFGSEDEEEELGSGSRHNFKWLKMTIAGLLAVVLLTNILAFWPQVYNAAAIKFLIKSRELSKNEAVQQYKQAVVEIKTGKSGGTGFSISNDGYIVTNEHVIDGGETLWVSFPDGTTHKADIVVSLPEIDIATIKINPDDDQPLPMLELEFGYFLGEALANGPPVYVIGNPLFFRFIANEGHVIGMVTLRDWDVPVLVIDAPIYKGNSGSPVITHDGKVIGVVFATTKLRIEGKSKKVGLAVPVDYFKNNIDLLK